MNRILNVKRSLHIFSLWILLGIIPGCRADFDRRQDQLQKTVQSAKSKHPSLKQPIWFQAKWFSHPAYPQNVCTIQNAKAQVVVVIITKNRGHAGMFGYLYADKGLQAKDVLVMLDTHGCGEWTLLDQPQTGWWRIENRLG